MTPNKILALDLRDIAVWLDATSPQMLGILTVDLNYTARERVISHVLPYCRDRGIRHWLRAEAIRALEALSYTVAPTGGDVYAVNAAPRSVLSAHQRIRCYDRIQSALAGVYLPPTSFESPTVSAPKPDSAVDDNF